VPRGTHICRIDPRDSLEDTIADVKRHGSSAAACAADLSSLIGSATGVDRGAAFLIIEASIARQFEFLQGLGQRRVRAPPRRRRRGPGGRQPPGPGDPGGPAGPRDLVDAIDRQVRESMARGAWVRTGGRRIGDRGCFYAPTVLTGVGPGMPAYDEETFGPVAAVIRVADEDQAIQVANDTAYGLGASVWTTDVDRGLRVARQLQSGAVFVNAVVASDPRLPFGGIKRSGYGRALAAAGIREFTNLRTWWVSGSAIPTSGAALTE